MLLQVALSLSSVYAGSDAVLVVPVTNSVAGSSSSSQEKKVGGVLYATETPSELTQAVVPCPTPNKGKNKPLAMHIASSIMLP